MYKDFLVIEELKEEIGYKIVEIKHLIEFGKFENGYQLNSDGCVTKLLLTGRNLSEFPKSILKFKDLECLFLNNNLFEKLPVEIGQLTNLTKMELANNQLTSLPIELGQLLNLKYLNLSNNKLGILPAEIGQLTNLEELNLFNNKLTSLPAEIGNLIKLKQMQLTRNQLTSLPSEIGLLTNLINFELPYNCLLNLPSEIGRLTKLKVLYANNNQLINLPSEIGQLTNLTELKLFNNQLTSLPAEIGQLTNLSQIQLSYNQLTSLPAEIGQIINFTKLDISYNKLTHLPPEIGHLINLKVLYINSNNLLSLPAEIGQLSNLMELELIDNQLTKLPPEISQLSSLEVFNLINNQLTSLPPEIGQLSNLEIFYLNNNQITSLPPEIGNLSNLEEFNLNNNQLTSLPSEIGHLKNLEEFFLKNNELTSLPIEIGQLSNLQLLNLDKNEINSIPSEIGDLVNLTELTLLDNNLTSLPVEICQLTELVTLQLYNNNFLKPPPEIAYASNNIKRIQDYFAELYKQGDDYIYEAKLILVGEPGAGKTSLSKKLMNPSYPLNLAEEMTKGIDVEKWKFPYSKDIPFQCNIWDFGGQEIMHATHRYFLTKRSLYILVADNRKENTDFYYWLQIIEMLSANSNILIVLNEKHKYRKYVPENILKSFKSVQKVFNVNLADNSGLSDLSKAIQQHMRDLPHVGKDPIPKKWVQIRKELEKDKRNYIHIDNYFEICKKFDITDKAKAKYISEFLHDLGVILHFQKDRILQNFIILNTRWATEAVYEILFDNEIIGRGGEFDNNDLKRIWYKSFYKNKRVELLQLMLNFELAYEIDKTQTYIIPELLPEKQILRKEFYSNEKSLIRFEYRYDFMPKGIISRLIVRMNRYIYNQQQWKNGVILKIGDSYIEIIEYFNENKIKIRIIGKDRVETLVIIRKEISELHDLFEKLSSHEMVPCNCDVCRKLDEPHFFDFDELKQYKSEGEINIKCRNGKLKDVNVLSLISDVFIEEVDKMGNDNVDRNRNNHLAPNIHVEGAKVFVSSQSQSLCDVDVTSHVDIDININIKVDLPTIQNDFVELKNAMSSISSKLENELNRIEDSLDEVSAEDTKKEFKKPFNKLGRLLSKLENEDSEFYKAIKATKKGIEIVQKVAKTYNKFAKWLVMPQVPDILL